MTKLTMCRCGRAHVIESGSTPIARRCRMCHRELWERAGKEFVDSEATATQPARPPAKRLLRG